MVAGASELHCEAQAYPVTTPVGDDNARSADNFIVNHLPGVDDLRAVADFYLRHVRCGPRSDDHDVGAGLANRVARHFNTRIDVDAGATGLALQVSGDAAKFAAIR